MSLLENVDPIISKIDGLKEVMLAIDPEIQLVRTDISNLIKELYIKTTEQFIRRWEEDFSLSYDPALALHAA